MPLSPRQAAYLNAMGIDLWREVNRNNTRLNNLALQSSWELPYGALPKWLLSQAVMQQYNVQPAVTQFVIISEWRVNELPVAPLFADETGALFDAMLGAIALSRDQVGLIGLADPADPGVENLAAVLAGLPLKVIFFMSALPENHSVESFVARSASLQTCMDIPLIASLHPAYLLANPQSKRNAWEDLKQVRALLTQ